MVSSRLVVPFRPVAATDMFDRFSTTSRRMYSVALLTPELKTLNSSKYEDEDNVYLKVTMPGLVKEDVKASASFSSHYLVIDAEKVMEDFELRKYGVTLDLPKDIDVTGIKQVMKAGILKVTLPKLKLKKEEMLDDDGDMQIKIN
ncbi:hypothetical protein CTI12_AA300430 [Artemisia annua]|uniref:SHSP domain-containing protein n=1 Tax=Artemisia annua TaxID=35608 RepID=A0A2U1N700_ARTAN|nr:hypothetical protein CTI12_AA300430 [Artemisia annua]